VLQLQYFNCCIDFAVNYFADFEEKQMRLKALRNRQDLFQEEVCSQFLPLEL